MAFFKALINRLIPDNNLLGAADSVDHYEGLERLRANHDWIDVKITKNGNTYQSLILEIDIENQELLIDDLYPPKELDSLEPGDTVEITSRSRRVLIHFYTRILARELRDGACYRLELPEEVGRNHSRGAYRVYVDSDVELNITMNFNGEALHGAHIINLSTEGLKLSFADDIAELLQSNSFFSDCTIHLPSGYDIDCEIEVCNIYRIRSPHLHTLSGGKLTINQPQHRVKLQQYLASVQRKQRRRESRIS